MNILRLSRRLLVVVVILSAVGMVCVPSATAAVTTPAETEPNDSQETAEEIEPGTTVSGEITDREDVDWYSFDAEAGETINVTADIGPGAGLKFKIKDPDSNTIASTRGSNTTTDIGVTAKESGTYYLQVPHWTGDGSTDYAFEVQTYQTTDREPNEGPETATDISVGETITDVIPERNDVDWYRFDAEAGETINVTADIGPGAGLKFKIMDPDRNSIGGTRGSNSTVVGGVTAQESGTYYLQVPHWTGDGSTDYAFEIQTYRTTGNEPNEQRDNATQLTLNTSIDDTISLGDTDWYAFDLQAGDSISISGTASSAGANNFNIHGPDENSLNGTQLGDGSFNLTAVAPSTGTHYFVVSQSSAPGADYTFDIRTNGTETTSESGENGGDDSDADDGDSSGVPIFPVAIGLAVVLILVVFLWRRDDQNDSSGQ